MARDEMRSWLSSWVDWEDDVPAVEATLASEVLPRLEGDSIFRLPDLRTSAEHDWGWVVGHAGFHEFVIVDRSAGLLTLIVASDD